MNLWRALIYVQTNALNIRECLDMTNKELREIA